MCERISKKLFAIFGGYGKNNRAPSNGKVDFNENEKQTGIGHEL